MKLIRFELGETNCSHCGTAIKNIFVVDDNGIEKFIGSECIEKLLGVETLPKEFKQLQKEVKNAQFNKPILEAFVNVKGEKFRESNLYKSLEQGQRKATDKAVLMEIVRHQLYTASFEKEGNRYFLHPSYILKLSHRAGDERRKTEEEYQAEVNEYKNNYKAYFLSDTNTKEVNKFITELISYIEENYKIWGWTVKYLLNREA